MKGVRPSMKKSVPVQPVAKIVASQAASTSFLFFFGEKIVKSNI